MLWLSIQTPWLDFMPRTDFKSIWLELFIIIKFSCSYDVRVPTSGLRPRSPSTGNGSRCRCLFMNQHSIESNSEETKWSTSIESAESKKACAGAENRSEPYSPYPELIVKVKKKERVLRTMRKSQSPRATPHTCVSMGNLNIWSRKIDESGSFRLFLSIFEFLRIFDGFEMLWLSIQTPWLDFMPRTDFKSIWLELFIIIKFSCSYDVRVPTSGLRPRSPSTGNGSRCRCLFMNQHSI